MAGCSKSSDCASSSTLLNVKDLLDDDADTMQCRLCNKTFCSETALRNHARMEHYEVFAKGDPEMYTYHIPDNVIKHVAAKTKQKAISMLNLVSKDVDYIIINQGDLKEEEVTSGRSAKSSRAKPVKEVKPITGPFECFQPSNLLEGGLCHQIFLSCCEYSIHYRDEHTRRRKCLRCQVCEKLLTPGVEDPEYPYPCHVCGESFQTSKERTAHMNTAHVKLMPYRCSVCNKRFTQNGGLNQHMRLHTGERPFACNFCDKAFTQKSGLDQHLRTHTKLRPFRCVVCDKTFAQSIHLRQHMRTHTNVAPFQCAICQKTFKQSSHMNYHLRIHGSADMSEEQKRRYAELLSIMDKEENMKTELDSEVVEQVVVESNVQVESVDGEFIEIS